MLEPTLSTEHVYPNQTVRVQVRRGLLHETKYHTLPFFLRRVLYPNIKKLVYFLLLFLLSAFVML